MQQLDCKCKLHTVKMGLNKWELQSNCSGLICNDIIYSCTVFATCIEMLMRCNLNTIHNAMHIHVGTSMFENEMP